VLGTRSRTENRATRPRRPRTPPTLRSRRPRRPPTSTRTTRQALAIRPQGLPTRQAPATRQALATRPAMRQALAMRPATRPAQASPPRRVPPLAPLRATPRPCPARWATQTCRRVGRHYCRRCTQPAPRQSTQPPDERALDACARVHARALKRMCAPAQARSSGTTARLGRRYRATTPSTPTAAGAAVPSCARRAHRARCTSGALRLLSVRGAVRRKRHPAPADVRPAETPWA
jgi:hypothetical protein